MQKRVLIGLTGALILLLTACSAKGGGTSMDAESNRDRSASLSAEASTSPLTKEDSSNPAPSDPSPDTADPTLQSLLSQMTLHEKVCQMLVVTPERDVYKRQPLRRGASWRKTHGEFRHSGHFPIIRAWSALIQESWSGRF